MNIFRCCMSSNIGRIGSVVSDAIGSLTDKYGQLDESILYDLKVILNETIINAVKHGNREDTGKSVKVSMDIAGKNLLHITVEDEGDGYDYKCLCDKLNGFGGKADIFNTPENGRGMQLVSCLCSSVSVNVKGNKIEVVKSLKNPDIY